MRGADHTQHRLFGARLRQAFIAGVLSALPTAALATPAASPAITSSDLAPGAKMIDGQEAPSPVENRPRVIFGRALDLDGQRPVLAYRSASAHASLAAEGRRVAGQQRFPTATRGGSKGISSGFGMRRHPIQGDWRAHLGVDMAAPAGSPVLSPETATVRSAGWQGSYGLMVTLDHGNGMITRYAHLSGVNVRAGQRIGKGAVLGFVGSTGRSTGSHLHYETWVNGQPINPLGR